eukprot:4568965-Pleurochrysis_carterae.AAC.5
MNSSPTDAFEWKICGSWWKLWTLGRSLVSRHQQTTPCAPRRDEERRLARDVGGVEHHRQLRREERVGQREIGRAWDARDDQVEARERERVSARDAAKRRRERARLVGGAVGHVDRADAHPLQRVARGARRAARANDQAVHRGALRRGDVRGGEAARQPAREQRADRLPVGVVSRDATVRRLGQRVERADGGHRRRHRVHVRHQQLLRWTHAQRETRYEEHRRDVR